ncbi:MAG: rhodanese-like domain-containing protein [Flavitalea sp.]
MNQISAEELMTRIDSGEDIFLIDVREEQEHEVFNIGGKLMPLTELMDHLDEIPKDREVIIYCKLGVRSQIAIQRLEQKGFTNLVNLNGGVNRLKKR